MKKISKIINYIIFIVLLSSCASTGKYGTYEELSKKFENSLDKNSNLQDKLKALDKDLGETSSEASALASQKDLLSLENTIIQKEKETIESEKDKLLSEKEKLLNEKKRLKSEKRKLMNEKENLKKEFGQLKKLKEATDKRNQDFKNLLSKLKKMIDAGTLTVNIRKGRMIVSLSSDILFKTGSVNITNEGKNALKELAQTLAEMNERQFLVVGHSDSDQITSGRFPSNWELSSQRAIEVTKLLINNQVQPSMLLAAGSAEFDPVASNDTEEGKKLNRRVEIVIMPNIEEIPGLNEFN